MKDECKTKKCNENKLKWWRNFAFRTRDKKKCVFVKDKVTTTRIEREILLVKMRGNGQRQIHLNVYKICIFNEKNYKLTYKLYIALWINLTLDIFLQNIYCMHFFFDKKEHWKNIRQLRRKSKQMMIKYFKSKENFFTMQSNDKWWQIHPSLNKKI